MIKIFKHKNYLFFALLILLYFYFDFYKVLFLKPQGIHFMRQTDSLSFAANYYNNGFHFFQTKVFNQQSLNGNAACEFPIIYYLAALLRLIYNNDVFILRLITLLISSTGFLYLFKLLKAFFKSEYFAYTFTFLFISSTVLLNYSINFLPDPSSLGLIFIGWFYFYNFINQRDKSKNGIIAFVFFTIASLLKVTFFIHPLSAFLTVICLDVLAKKSFKIIVKENINTISIMFFSLLIIISWNLYMIDYNIKNQVKSFLFEPLPIWNLSKKEIFKVWDYMSNYWFTKYYFQTTFHLFFLVTILGILFIKKGEKVILIPAVFVFSGTLAFFTLFYSQFKEHDYYFITLIPAIVFIVSSSFVSLKNKFPNLINHFSIKLILALICLLSLNYANKKLAERFSIKNDLYAVIGDKLSNSESFINTLNISKKAKFIIVPDLTPNGGLYFINHSGWNIQDSSSVSILKYKKYIRKGADYVILTDSNYITNLNFNFKSLQFVGEDNGLKIFKISQ